MKKVLFISAQVGAGHDSAAKSIINLIKKEELADTLLIDSYSYANSIIGNLFAQIYLNIISHIPTLYKKIYISGKHKNSIIYKFRKQITLLSYKKFDILYQQYKPDIVIATHSFSAGIISKLKEKYPNIPTISIITDFAIHPFWIYKNIDIYAVDNIEIKNELIKYGINEKKIYITGIPVNSNFYLKDDEKKLKKELDLIEDLPLILVMGGANGLIDIDKIIEILNKISSDFQIVFITGKNIKLYYKLKNINFVNPYIKKVQIIKFTDYVYKYMKASKLLISKPGGLTSAESIASNTPLLITDPIPGHEEKNMNYLVKNGYALILDNEKTIEKILSNKLIFNYINKKKNNSTLLILKLIKDQLNLDNNVETNIVYKTI